MENFETWKEQEIKGAAKDFFLPPGLTSICFDRWMRALLETSYAQGRIDQTKEQLTWFRETYNGPDDEDEDEEEDPASPLPSYLAGME